MSRRIREKAPKVILSGQFGSDCAMAKDLRPKMAGGPSDLDKFPEFRGQVACAKIALLVGRP